MSNFFKKVTSTVSVVAIVASAMSSTLVANAANQFAPYADALATAGIISKQTTEAGYNLGNNVTRAEMAKVAVNIKKAEVKECTGKVFSDVSSALGDLCGYVEAAAAAGLVNQTAAKFRPMDLVTRAEMLKMLLGAQGIAPITEDMGFKDLGSDESLNGYINAAAKAGIINRVDNFNPNNTATRGEAFKVAANSTGLTTSAVEGTTGDDLDLSDLFGDDDTGTDTTTDTTGTTTTVAAGDLEVGLGAASPVNGAQIPSTGIIRFSVVDFTAGGSDISVNTVELNKAGLTSIPSGTKVWFEKNGTRLSGKASFTSENNAVVSFAPALVVKAGSTESLDLYVELTNGSIGSDMQFTSAAIVSSAVNTTGSFTTPALRVTSYTVASSTFTAQTSGQTYNASSDAVEFAKFTVANTDTNSDTRDLKLQSIALYQSGSADLTNLSDITLERNGIVVSSVAVVSGKTLTITASDTIKDGASAIYILRAKIVNVELTTDTYQFYLKNTSDISLVEVDNGFRSNLTAPVSVAALYNVTGGDVKFERDTTSALSQTVAPGTSDVTLMKGTITAKSAVTLEDINIAYTTSASGTVSMNTVYLQIGSATFTATPADSSTTAGTLTFLGTATVSGTAPVRMYVKLKDGATGTIKVDSLNIGKFTLKEYAINQNTVTSAIGSIDGVTVTVGASTLNVSRTDGLGTTSLASGTKGVTVYGARFSSTQGNPIALSNFSLVTTGNALSYTGGNTSLTLYVDGVAKSTQNVNTTAVSFVGFNATVSTTQSVDVVIKADFSDVTTSGSFGIASIDYDAVDSLTSVNVTPVTVAGATFNIAAAIGTL
ncbi:MAG: S-layer homology domain-containing protein, partial [Candidatus Gracilibacteria bacterium]|nr:S-layer homology domain-containing protein [Candidatus Gracilibacteria bacterium]